MAGTDQSGSSWHVCTGHLPSPEIVATLVAAAHNRFKSNPEGKNSAAYPALERVQRDFVRVCLVDAGGPRLCGGRRRTRVYDHERFKAVRLRIGLSGTGGGRNSPKNWRERDRIRLQLAGRHRTKP